MKYEILLLFYFSDLSDMHCGLMNGLSINWMQVSRPFLSTLFDSRMFYQNSTVLSVYYVIRDHIVHILWCVYWSRRLAANEISLEHTSFVRIIHVMSIYKVYSHFT